MRVKSFAAWVSTRQGGADRLDKWPAVSIGHLHLRYLARGGPAQALAPGETLIVNDDAEYDEAVPDRCLAGGMPVRVDAEGRRVIVHTSIVGLPPLFIYSGEGVSALASDISSLARIPGVRLELDPVGVSQLGLIGYPIARRTLYRNVVLAGCGERVALDESGALSSERSWEFPPVTPLALPEYLEMQAEAFAESVRALDADDSFLSLTAGLDTRAVLSELARGGRLLPGATMTAEHRSLDAITASALCSAYGVRHTDVVIGADFERDLPRYVREASLLSGGLSSIKNATEIRMYEVMGPRFTGRVSGDLGNQVGRGGTEGVSVRGADLSVLSGEMLREESADTKWLISGLRSDPYNSARVILQSEVPFTSTGIFGISSSFARQQSPYANRRLIETLANQPSGPATQYRSRMQMRIRDLHHRFAGEETERSFQRMLVARNGGPAAVLPVNWGWRPVGGISLSGAVRGVATLAGMAVRAKGLDSGHLGSALGLRRLAYLHDFRESRRWLRSVLSEFVQDTLSATSIRQSGLFEVGRLDTVLSMHFKGGVDLYQTVTFALDVALAHDLFVIQASDI